MRITPHAFQRRDLFALIAVVLVAAVLRFTKIAVTEYRYDEARHVRTAQDFIAGKYFPTVGQTNSVGIPAPPTMELLVALPYLVSSNPLFAEFYIVALNLTGVALLYVIAQRYFSRTVALVASLTFACSPWAMQFSREIWPPNVITPFVLASIFCGLLGFVEGRRWAQVLCLPLLSIAIGIHFGALALLTVFAWFLWRKHASRRAVGLSVAITVIMLIPYFTSFTGSNFDAIRAHLGQDPNGGWAVTPALAVIARFASSSGVERAFGLSSAVYTDRLPLVFWIIVALPVAIGLIGVRSHPLAPLLYLWALSAALILTILPLLTYDHYLVASIPALCLLAGVGLDAVAARLHSAILAGWVVVLAVQCLLWFNLLDAARTTPMHDFGPPLVDLLPIRDQLSSADDLLITGGVTGVSGYDIWSTMLFRSATCVRELIIADGGIAVLPDHPFSLLRAPNATPYEFADLYTSARQIVFPLREGEGSYTLDQIEAPPVWDGPELTPIQPAPFDNGAVLNGYRFADGRLYLDWSLSHSGAQDYQYFIHLLDGDGERIAQHDSSFYPGKYWCPGDRIITFVALEPPPGTAVLRIGMYRFENGNITGSNVFDDAGNAAPWVDIALPIE